MKRKYFNLLLILAIAIMVLAGCAPAPAEEPAEKPSEELVLTLEELAEYDGKDGRRAYVAVDGIIYDMTDSPAWKEGGHNGFQAGQDLTDAIKNDSPHGVGKLENVPAVGKLAD